MNTQSIIPLCSFHANTAVLAAYSGVNSSIPSSFTQPSPCCDAATCDLFSILSTLDKKLDHASSGRWLVGWYVCLTTSLRRIYVTQTYLQYVTQTYLRHSDVSVQCGVYLVIWCSQYCTLPCPHPHRLLIIDELASSSSPCIRQRRTVGARATSQSESVAKGSTHQKWAHHLC
jgi:hypothetical protein